MLKKVIASCLVTCAAGAAMGQDSTKSLTVSGSVDAYYRYNFNAQGQGYESAGGFNSATSFTRSQSIFELGMASVKLDATALSGKVGATVDVGYGHRAEEFSYNDVGSALGYLKQAYITYAPSKYVKFTAGKFATHVGYELVDAYANRNYSMSYMFSYGPFFHTGLKADFTLGKVGVMVGVASPVDRSTTTTGVKTLLAQVSSTSSSKVKAYLNYWGYFGNDSGNPEVFYDGAKSVNQVDLVVTGVVTSKFNIGFNGTLQAKSYNDSASTNTNWFGAALYLNYDPTSAFGLTLRGEYIGDKDTYTFGTKSLFEVTLSANYKVGPFTLVPEFRYDGGKDKVFEKKNGFTKTTPTALLAAIYKF